MLKKIALLVILFTITSNAQNVVSGTFTPQANYSWIMLYQLKGAKQVYIANSAINKGKFSIEIPATAQKGMFRLVYSMDEGGSIDFIYNKKDISLTFNPQNAIETLQFANSKENELYANYLKESTMLQFVADSLQLAYFKDKENRKIAKKYRRNVKTLSKLQNKFEKNTKEMPFAYNLIKANAKFYPKNIVENPQEFLNNTKNHFFDGVDFLNPMLQNTTIISEKVINYVFGLHTSDDVEVQNKLYKKATQEVLQKVEKDTLQKKNNIELLLFNFATMQNIPMVDFLTKKYQEIPKNLQDENLLKEINDKMRLAIGKVAPNFSWEKPKKTDLYKQSNVKNYLLVFWSTTCSHCLDEIPKLYDYTKNNKELQVIAIALEDDELGFNYYTEGYTKWINVLSLNKWKNGIAQQYEVVETPTYFVLDENKTIIGKPEFLKDVKAFLKPLSEKQ